METEKCPRCAKIRDQTLTYCTCGYNLHPTREGIPTESRSIDWENYPYNEEIYYYDKIY